MNYYSMQQADNMALNAIKSSHVTNGIVHVAEHYNPVCKASIPEIYQVIKNSEVIDECWSLEQAEYSARVNGVVLL